MRYREKMEMRGSRLEQVSGSCQLAMDQEMEKRGNRASSLDR
jgi:hypothetical protein